MQEGVSFRRLGLVVIDEQHRFGVEQRAALIGKGAAPDVLLLTATPIPRSLALTLYGDLDVSTLKERPPGRGTVRTGLRMAKQRDQVLDFVRQECGRGRQAYVVLPVIEESERADLRAATTMAQSLAARWTELTVGLVHGRLKPEERDGTMRRFRAGEIQVLVATTVIEVGIDVPNATVMLVEHPERFGLAQLHQLRGRIGRGAEESYCILLAEGPGMDRLRAFAATRDGFRIAELDLAERGMGDLIGARQSGGFELRHAQLPVDEDLLARARDLATGLIGADPALQRSDHQPLRERAVSRYPRAMELFRVG
jgi:ATP-dependent DNA helicase RecG